MPSEASLRFKRGTDPTLPALAARRFAELLNEISPGLTLHPGVIDVDHVGSREPVLVRTDKVNSVLGTDLGRDEIGRPHRADRVHVDRRRSTIST